MANKMADKKKTTNKSQMVAPPARSNGNKKTSQMVAPSAHSDGSKKTSEMVAPPTQVNEKEQSKVVKAAASERSERKVQETKTVRRDNRSSSRSPSAMQVRVRNNRYIRFILEAYYELRHKVTWPSFPEARNMTIAVILLSVAVGLILGAADLGLYQLFLLISHIGGVK